ncbi:thymidine phosphorylase family protein [Fontimonas sp. SYSU GA230001]|uniref:thymidine phosphorylase family protein n=1 Tax=Fontimonas sp. SYSU GA230001 TaxID=3142450 RepID=UPI0032B4F784
MPHRASALVRLRRAGIDTYQSPVIYMRGDSAVCRSEGFEAQSRVEIVRNQHRLVATLNVVSADWLAADEAALSEVAWRLLGAHEGDTVELRHPDPLDSLSALRAKVYGRALAAEQIAAIVRDVAAGRYSDLELAAFVTACAGDRLDVEETTALTRAMVEAGDRLSWNRTPVMDKHCIGGLPGNRTTLIVVPIVAACGLTIPKTSSRAITSPAGTADTMETLAPVELSLEQMRRVVEQEGGCIAWGGSVRLSPADDVLIRVERPLDFDSEGQLVASVLSKKLSAGSTHAVIDIPVGPTAKMRTEAAGRELAARLTAVGAALGLQVSTLLTDGTQPVGRGIGPALEARDVLAVLQNREGASRSLRDRALLLAASVLELAGHSAPGSGRAAAEATLASGAAWAKFQAIARAQGGLREPPKSRFHRPWPARAGGRVSAIDNRKLSRLAKLAGAPRAPAAGLDLHVRIGDVVVAGQPLFTLHAESAGEIAFALDYLEDHPEIVCMNPAEAGA